MRDKDFKAGENLWSIFVYLVAILIAIALWTISRQSTTLASAGFSLESSQAWSFLIFCAGVAGLTMAFVQVCRMLYPFRGHFHREALEQWLSLSRDIRLEDYTDLLAKVYESLSASEWRRDQPDSGEAGRAAGEEAAKLKTEYELLSDWTSVLKELDLKYPDVQDALREFEQRRGVASRTSAEANPYLSSMVLYDLPIEQLSGQLNLAFEAGLDEPRRFKNLIVLMAGMEGAGDLLKVIRPLSKSTMEVGDGGDEQGDQRGDLEAEAEYSKEALAQAQSRAAITRIGQLRIDAFQISAGGRWRFRLRLVVLAVSFVCSFIILFNSTPMGDVASGARAAKLLKVPIQAAYSVVVGAIAGYLAMFLRDLIAIVESKRRRS